MGDYVKLNDIRFVIITGLSGAGKSEATRSFEDLGYFCVDNLPPTLIPKFAQLCVESRGKIQKVALVIDIRGGDFFNTVFDALEYLEQNGYSYQIVYLEASTESLVRRFKETRRRHPLVSYGGLMQGIEGERKILDQLRGKANEIINTTNCTAQQLKQKITEIFKEGDEDGGLNITVVSFGFKYGTPLDADLVFDVRFLPNPHHVSSLKSSSGNNDEVKTYVMKWHLTKAFLDRLYSLLDLVLPEYEKEGKIHLVIALGCTGGRHRSVTIGNEVTKYLKDKDYKCIVEHRDIKKS